MSAGECANPPPHRCEYEFHTSAPRSEVHAVQELGCAALASLAEDPEAQELLASKGGPASVLNAMRRCAGGA